MNSSGLTLLAFLILIIGLILWITGARGRGVQFVAEVKK